MLNLRFNLSVLRPLRWLAIGFACVLMITTQAYPAFAAGSRPTQGETQLKNIESKSIDVLEEGGPYSLEKTSSIAKEGVNEVQGGADKDKMKNPENSRNAPQSVEQRVIKSLENLKDSAKDLVD